MFFNWYIVLILLSVCFLKFMFICIWKRMRNMNDKLIARMILRWAIFISIWLPLTAPVNTTNSFGNKFCNGIYNDHDQIMNYETPNDKLPLPYAPLLILIYISMIILTITVYGYRLWFRQSKKSAVESLVSNSPTYCVQRPKDMDSMLLNFSLVILIAINSIGSLIWRKYEKHKILRINSFFIIIIFFLVCSLMKWQCTQIG